MGLPLQVRRESFAGVGHPETFTKTNTLSNKLESPRSQSKIEFIKDATKTPLIRGRKIPRALLHVSVIALAVFAVTAGQVKSEAKISTASTSSKTANNESVSLIATGAVLSEGTSSMVNSDVSQKAKDLNAQAVLSTAGDDFLAKKLPVLTTGAPSREIITYTVKDGDTLSSLASKFNITSDTIKWANNITDETSIKPGDNLTILPVSGILYTGTGTDNLDQLATQYQANSALIDSFNSLDGKSPAAGQKIIIPDGVKPSPVAAPAASVASKNTSSVGTISSAYTGPVTSGGGSFANTYAYGYCTWYVAGRRYIPNMLGNANQWPYNAPRAGMAVGSTPRAGAAGVTRWGNHVVYIERVEGSTVYYSDMNGAAGWGRVGYGSGPASNYIYIY